jgi:hypothetical protein
MGFHHVVHACVRRGVPIVFLDFPRLVHDPEYLYWQLAPIIGHSVQHGAAINAHRRVAKPELVRVGKELAQGSEMEFPSFAALDRAALFRELRRVLAESKQCKEGLLRHTASALIRKATTSMITYPFRLALSAFQRCRKCFQANTFWLR